MDLLFQETLLASQGRTADILQHFHGSGLAILTQSLPNV
jgi:hypothetical protein